MKKFHVKFSRVFEVDVTAETLDVAQMLARNVIAQFPKDSCTLLSIIPEDYVEPEKTETAQVKLSTEEQRNLERNTGLAKKVKGYFPGGIDDMDLA